MEFFIKLREDSLPVLGTFLLKVLLAIIVYIVCSRVIKWVCGILRKSMTKAGVPAEAVSFINSLSKVGLYALLIFSIATQFGVEASSVAALLASAGVGISLALQGGLSNLAGGVIILIFKPFTVGDYIIEDTGNHEGTVQKIEMYYTTLLTMDNQRVMVPNATLTNNIITNVTAMDERKLDIKVGISYDSDLKKAKKILMGLIEAEDRIEKSMEIQVFVDGLCDSFVRLGLRAWVKTDQYWAVRWKLNEDIKISFEEAGIKIPYPQMDIHMIHEEKDQEMTGNESKNI
ncbi:MAG: mechanosensitive ion channel family protein [Ruminococcus sp.]|jgi:small conductance mechanosensitive channel